MNTLSFPASFATSLSAVRPAPGTLSPGVAGGVRLALRAEGLAILAASLALFAHAGFSWGLFAALFLVPDLSLLGYLGGSRSGAIFYNCAHSLLGPIVLGVGAVLAAPAALPYALIWAAHVGFDRALGYGLKYASAFGNTHLGQVGRAPRG
jgi:hypothetical protein